SSGSLRLGCVLERFLAGLAGADANEVLDGRNPDLPVANPVGTRGSLNLVDDAQRVGVLDDDLDLHLWQEVDLVLRTPVDLRVTALSAEALYFGHGHALHARGFERSSHIVELVRLYDCGHDLHVRSTPPPAGVVAGMFSSPAVMCPLLA